MSAGIKTGYAVYIETYGCQMNVYDTSAMFGLLVSAGFRRAPTLEDADVVLLNTCSVREHAEHRVLSRVGELRHRLRGDSGRPILGICGCMAERLRETLVAKGSGVDLACGVDQYDRLPDDLLSLLNDSNAPRVVATGHRDDVHYVAPPDAYPQNNSHLVTIHKGCDYRCTYCIVPDTRGPQREKSPDTILDEIRSVIAAGGVEVTLLGQNVTAYRWGDELNFATLLRRVAASVGLKRIRFLTGHPRDMTDELLHTIADEPKICPVLHLPLQSGSDRVLKRMKRLHKRDEYLAMIDKARAWIPEVTFSSDFIVGFPGETDRDFRDTLEVLREVQYDQVFSFKYSARPGTPAARLEDDVPPAEKKRRLAELMSVQGEVWCRVAAAQVGQIWHGTLESPARAPAKVWRMRTMNNRKVLLELPSATSGSQVTARITGYENTTFWGKPLRNAR